MYKVSLIVPLYNVEHYIERSLGTILNQSLQSIEIIFVDDCSTDNTLTVLKSLISNHSRFSDISIYCQTQNKGASAARNLGLKKATGDYVFFMDSDDEITLDCIEKHLNIIEKYQVDFTIANIRMIGGSTIHNTQKVIGLLAGEEIIQSYLKREWVYSPCNKMLNREFLLSNSLFFKEGVIYEDILWNYSLALSAKKMFSIDSYTYLYIIRSGSVTNSHKTEKEFNSFISILDSITFSNPPMKDLTHFRSFIAFLRFTASLSLCLGSSSDFSTQKQFYNKINRKEYKVFNANNIHSFLLNLPFSLFKTLLYFPYWLYRKSSRN